MPGKSSLPLLLSLHLSSLYLYLVANPFLRNDSLWKDFMRPNGGTEYSTTNVGEQMLVAALSFMDIPFRNGMDQKINELKEEVNLNLPRNRFFNIETFNCRHIDKGYHAISLIMYSEIQEEEKKEIKNLEPDKCEKWFWVSFGQLRNQMNSLFYPLKDFLNKHPKMNSVDYLKGLVKTPIVSFQKQEKKKSISTQDTGSPFSASTWDDDSLLLKDDLMMI